MESEKSYLGEITSWDNGGRLVVDHFFSFMIMWTAFCVRAVSLENLVSVQIIFGNQPVGLSSRDAQLAETDSFFTKIW